MAGVIGNADYMSPEQALGRPVGPPGDLYQVGVLAYVLLTGRPPFPRADPAQVLAAHVSSPPPVPSELNPVAARLDRVVGHAMAKSPGRRYADAAQFRCALAAAVAGLPPAGSSVSAPAGAASSDGVSAAAGAGTVVTGPRMTRVLPVARPLPDPTPTGVPRAVGRARRRRSTVSRLLGAAAAVIGAAPFGAIRAAAAPEQSVPTAAPTLTTAPATPVPTPTAPVVAPVVRESTPVPTPTPTPTPTSQAVPALSGDLTAARATIQAAGFELGTLTRVLSPSPVDHVLSQQPAAGALAPPGSTIDLVVATGTNAVPTVAGLTPVDAATVLRQAGFLTAATTGATGSVVTGTRPTEGTVADVGSAVDLVVAAQTPTPTPTRTSTATPSGSP